MHGNLYILYTEEGFSAVKYTNTFFTVGFLNLLTLVPNFF